jgi:regulator of RNase E activity RraA
MEVFTMDGETAAFSRRLKKLSSSLISDVLDECGYPQQVLSSKITPLARDMRMAGPALCFGGMATVDMPSNGEKQAISSYEIDHRIIGGGIVLIATQGYSASSVVGGLMALGFVKKDCAGIVTDGSIRDAKEILDLGLPTFCQYINPRNSAKRWSLTDIDQPISLPGQETSQVIVEPMDYVIGDADGIVIIPRAIAADVISWAEHLAAIEENIVHHMQLGFAREDVFQANPRFSHIRRLKMIEDCNSCGGTAAGN